MNERPSPVIREATLADCHVVAAGLRAADIETIRTVTKGAPLEGVITSFNASTYCFAVIHDGEPIALFGAATLEDGTGCPWVLATDQMGAHIGWALRTGPQIIELLQRHYPLLAGFADLRDGVMTRYLGICGFSLGREIPFGNVGVPFQLFWRQR